MGCTVAPQAHRVPCFRGSRQGLRATFPTTLVRRTPLCVHEERSHVGYICMSVSLSCVLPLTPYAPGTLHSFVDSWYLPGRLTLSPLMPGDDGKS